MNGRVFTVSELWGPFACEMRGCPEKTLSIVLTDVENLKLPEPVGPKAARYIMNNSLGVAYCKAHLLGVSL